MLLWWILMIWVNYGEFGQIWVNYGELEPPELKPAEMKLN
jgi:hypothetical protein